MYLDSAPGKKRAAAAPEDEPFTLPMRTRPTKKVRWAPLPPDRLSRAENKKKPKAYKSSVIKPFRGPSSAEEKEEAAAFELEFFAPKPADVDYEVYLRSGSVLNKYGDKARKGQDQPLDVTRLVFYWAMDRTHSFCTAHVQTRWLVVKTTSALEAGNPVPPLDLAFLHAFHESKETPHLYTRREAYILAWKYTDGDHDILPDFLVVKFNRQTWDVFSRLGGRQDGNSRRTNCTKPKLAALSELLGRHEESGTMTRLLAPVPSGAPGHEQSLPKTNKVRRLDPSPFSLSEYLSEIETRASTMSTYQQDMYFTRAEAYGQAKEACAKEEAELKRTYAQAIDAATRQWGPGGFIVQGDRIIPRQPGASGAINIPSTRPFLLVDSNQDPTDYFARERAIADAKRAAAQEQAIWLCNHAPAFGTNSAQSQSGFVAPEGKTISTGHPILHPDEMRISDFTSIPNERSELEIVQELIEECEAEEQAEMDELTAQFERTMNTVTEQSRMGSMLEALGSLGVADPGPTTEEAEDHDDDDLEAIMRHEFMKAEAEDEHKEMLRREQEEMSKGWLQKPKFNFTKLKKIEEEEEL